MKDQGGLETACKEEFYSNTTIMRPKHLKLVNFFQIDLRTSLDSSLSVNNFPTSLSMRFGLISSPRAEFVKRYIEKRVKEWLSNHA